MNNKRLTILTIFGIAGIIAFLHFSESRRNFDKGRQVGREEGIDYMLDTMSTIVHNQYMSDTTITKITFANKDTVTYFLSRHTVIPKK